MGWFIQLIADALGLGGQQTIHHQANCASAEVSPRFSAACTAAARHTAAAAVAARYASSSEVEGC